MKTQIRNSIRITAAAFSLLVLVSVTPANASGRTSLAVLNTILSGKDAPASSLGTNGDFYIDNTSLNFYGPKAKNKWPQPLSLKGPAGPAGAEGKASKSSSGATISNAASVSGPKGDRGEKGEKGDKGEVGAAGIAGANGFVSPGAIGPAGANGSNGSPGATGAQGVQGIQGLKGETGTAISSAKYGVITFASPINAPYSYQNSDFFGSFANGGNYVVDIYLYSTLTDNQVPELGVAFTASGGLRIVQSNYIVSSGSSFRTGAVKNETSVMARLLITIDSMINPKITLRASSSTATSGNVQTLTGYFTEQEVGSVS